MAVLPSGFIPSVSFVIQELVLDFLHLTGSENMMFRNYVYQKNEGPSGKCLLIFFFHDNVLWWLCLGVPSMIQFAVLEGTSTGLFENVIIKP